MYVEHEIIYRSFETGCLREVEIETRTGDLPRSFSIQDAEGIAELIVSLDREIKGRDLAPFADFRIFAVILADRDGLIAHIRDMEKQFIQLRFDFTEFLIDGRDLLSDFSHASDSVCRIFAIFLCHCDLLGFCILFALQRFGIAQEFSSLAIECEDFVQIEWIVTVDEVLLHFVCVFSDEFHV